MLTSSEVQSFLAHPEGVIREFAALYFANSFSCDPGLMSLVLSNCESEDEVANRTLLEVAENFLQSQETLDELFRRIAREDTYRPQYIQIVYGADPCLLEKNLSKLKEYPFSQEKVANTVALTSLSTAELWEKLLDYAEVNANESYDEFDLDLDLDDFDHDLDSDRVSERKIIRELAQRTDFPEEEMRRRLQATYSDEDYNSQIYFELTYMSLLAGERRDAAAIPSLIEIIALNEDFISDAAVEALTKIGTAEVIAKLSSRYQQEDEYFRQSTAILFGQVKIAEAEEALLQLLPEEEDNEIASVLADSLCQLLSTRGIPLVQAVVAEEDEYEAGELEESLYCNCIINNIELPELEFYRDRILEEREDDMSLMEEMAWFEEELPVTQPIKTGPKIGRNQPCPCGSGEKYKKCCGLN